MNMKAKLDEMYRALVNVKQIFLQKVLILQDTIQKYQRKYITKFLKICTWNSAFCSKSYSYL